VSLPRIAGDVSAKEEIDETAGKCLRPQSAHARFEQLAQLTGHRIFDSFISCVR